MSVKDKFFVILGALGITIGVFYINFHMVTRWDQGVTANNCYGKLDEYCGNTNGGAACYVLNVSECDALRRAQDLVYLEGLPVAIRDVYKQYYGIK